MRWAMGCSIVGSLVSSAFATVTATNRGDLLFVSAQVERRPTSDPNTILSNAFIYADSASFGGLLPGTNTLSKSASGSRYDDATGTVLVASGNGSASVTSNVNYTSGTQIASYTLGGSYSSSIQTGTLSGYNPTGTPADSTADAADGPGYNSGLSVVATVDTPFSISISQSNAVATAFNAAYIYHDLNDNQNEDTGETEVVPYFVIGGNDSMIMFGTLPASTSPYRVFFFGNLSNVVTTDNTAFSSGANFSDAFVVNPEPGSLGLILLALAPVVRRRRTYIAR